MSFVKATSPLILIFLALVLLACKPQTPSSVTSENTQLGAPEVTDLSIAPRFSILGSQTYLVLESFTIANHGPGQPDKHNLWVAMIQDISPYQQVLEMTITPDDYDVVIDEYGNRIAEFDLAGIAPGETFQVQLRYTVRVNQLAYDLSGCSGDLPDFFTLPELHVESNNPQIRELSADLSAGTQNTCQQARAFYDHIGNNLIYTFNGRNWGAQAALGEMGADCTEYASLMMALSRAAGIPARYLEGLVYFPDPSEAQARTEHAWLELYLPGIGWTPFDPTLGRSSLFRENYFAAISADHFIISRGRNPSTLRGGSYWTHIYWPGGSATVNVEDFGWEIEPLGE